VTSFNSAFNPPFLYPYVHIYPGLSAPFVSLFSDVSFPFVSIGQIPLLHPTHPVSYFPRSLSARKFTVSIPTPQRSMNHSVRIRVSHKIVSL